MKSKTIGIAAIIDKAAKSPQSCFVGDIKDARPTGSVQLSLLVLNVRAKRNSFQAAKKEKSEVTANWTFTLEDARTALLSYDTEYRDCIGEQFDEACFEKWRSELMNKDVNEQVEHWLSLSLRISES